MKTLIKPSNAASIKPETIPYFIKLTLRKKQYDDPDTIYSNEEDFYVSYQKRSIYLKYFLGKFYS